MCPVTLFKDLERSAGLGALLAGAIGLLALLTVPLTPSLYSPTPLEIIVQSLANPWASALYRIHFLSMALAGALALPAVFVLFQALRGRNRLLTLVSFVASILLAAGLIGFGYACVRNALSFPRYGIAYADGSTDAALAAAQSLNNHTRRVVLMAGYAFVAGVSLFSLGIWKTKVMSGWLATIGLANTAIFCFEFLIGFRLMRMLVEYLGLSLPLWGIAPPPPSDYLFAIWFIILGANLLKHQREGLGRFPAD